MLATILAAFFMYGFDGNVVNVALPALQRELAAGPVALELVVGAYVFAYAGTERARALTWFAIVGGISGLCGQTLGVLLLVADPAELGWRVIFLVNLPIGAVVLPAAARLLPAGRQPLVDLRLFVSRSFNYGLAINAAFMVFFASSIFVVSLTLQNGLGLSALQAGLAFAPMAVLAIPAAPLVPAPPSSPRGWPSR